MRNFMNGISKGLAFLLATAMVFTSVPSTILADELIVDESISIDAADDVVVNDAVSPVVKDDGDIDSDTAAGDITTAGEEEINPDTTAQDAEIEFLKYKTADQHLTINDYYAADYAALYAGDNTAELTVANNNAIKWDKENDYSFFLTPSAGYKLPGNVGDTGLYKTIKMSYVDATGKATQAAGTAKAAEGGTDFTVSDPDKNGRVLVTIKSAFIKDAYAARGQNYIDAKTAVPVTVDVDTVAVETSFQFVQATNIKIEGDGALMTIGTDALEAKYNKNFIFDIDAVLAIASKRPTSTPVSKVELTYVDPLGKTKTEPVGTDITTVNATTWSGGTDAGKKTYYHNNFNYETGAGEITFAIHQDIVNDLIAGVLTDPVITITFKKTEDTKMKVKVADGVTTISNYHVGLKEANATDTDQKPAGGLVVSFKGKDSRIIEKIFYSIDGGEKEEVVVGGPNTGQPITSTDNTWSGDAANTTKIPDGWYYATIPEGKVVGSEMTLSIQTAEALSFSVDKDLSNKWYASIESDNQLIAKGGTNAGIETDETVTSNVAYTFTVTPVTGREVESVKYTVQGGSAVPLTAAADGITYTIDENIINKPTSIAVTTKPASSGKHDVVVDSLTNITSVKDLSGTVTLATTAGVGTGKDLATDNEYFYFRVDPDANYKVTKVEYTDGGSDAPTTKIEATLVSEKTDGTATYMTSTKILGNVKLFVTVVESVYVVKPDNKMVTFTGEETVAKGSEYSFTVTPVASDKGETRIIKVSYKLDTADDGSFAGPEVLVYNNKMGKTGSHTATLVAAHAVQIIAVTKVVVDKAKYTAEFKEDYPEIILPGMYPGLTVSDGKYTLELANGEEKVVGGTKSGVSRELYLDIKDATTKQELASITAIGSADPADLAVGTPVFAAGKTDAATKVIDIAANPTNTITGNKKSTISDATDTVTVTAWINDTANTGLNQFEYSAELGIKVDDLFSEIVLKSDNQTAADGKDTFGEGYLIKKATTTEVLTVYGKDGRTGVERPVVATGATNDLYTGARVATDKSVVWTVSPDFNAKAAKAYQYALTGGDDDNNAVINTITYKGDADADIPASFAAEATVTDKWGVEYKAGSATVDILDDPIKFVMIPTVKRINSAEDRSYKKAVLADGGDLDLEADGGINSADVSFEIYQQTKDVAATLDYTSSKEDVVAEKTAGKYVDAPTDAISVTWELDDYLFDETDDGTGNAVLYDRYYKLAGAWTKIAAGAAALADNTTDYYVIVPSTEDYPNEYITVTGSGLNWKISAIEGAEHKADEVICTIATPTIKIGDFAYSAFSAATDRSNCDGSLEVNVGGRIEKNTVRLFINDNTKKTTGADAHVVEQKLQETWLEAAGVTSVMTTNYTALAENAHNTAEGYSIGYEIPEVTDGTYFKLPSTSNLVAENIPEGRFIYGWWDGTNYYDVDEEVAITADKDFYALWAPKYIVTKLYNDNLTNKDEEGEDIISGAVDTVPAAFDLNYYGGDPKTEITVGLGVQEVKGIISYADGAKALSHTDDGKTELGDIEYSTSGVVLNESDGSGKPKTTGTILDQDKLAAGKVEFTAVAASTKIQATYKKDNVSYTWNGAYVNAVPATHAFAAKADIALFTNFMDVDGSGNGTVNNLELGINQTVDTKDYELTLSEVPSMKANTQGVGITATLKAGTGSTKTVVPYWGITRDTGNPTNVYAGTYNWKSSNEAVATVVQTPTVAATKTSDMNTAHIYPKSQGTADITFTFKDPSGIERSEKVTVTVTAQTTFIKFADKDGNIIDDPAFLETWTGTTRKNTYYLVATDASNNILTGGTFNAVAKTTTYLDSISFADSMTVPGLNIATVTGKAAFGKDKITFKYTDTDTSIVVKEVDYKTYDKLEFNDDGAVWVKSYEIGGVTQVGADGKPDVANKPFIKVYSDDVKKTDTTPASTNYTWSYEIDISRYTATPKNVGHDFNGWFLKSALSQGKATKADGTEVTTTNTTAVKDKIIITNAAAAATDNTEFVVPHDVVLKPYFKAAAITNVSGIPSETVKLSDAVTTVGPTATSYKSIDLGITPGTTSEVITATAEDLGFVTFFDNKAGDKPAATGATAYNWATGANLGTPDTLDLAPNNNAAQGTRTDKLIVGMAKGKAGKTTVNITTGAGVNKKVLGSFTVAISGAKYDVAGKIVGYYDEEGELLKNASKVIAGTTYYFDEEGKVVVDGIVKLEEGWVLIAGGVKETKAGLYDLAGKTYCIKADGVVAHGELAAAAGKTYYFREDGTMVKYTDADVKDGKFTDSTTKATYVIDKDTNEATLDDVKYNPTVNWASTWPAKWTKGSVYPTLAYTITYTSKNTGKSVTTESITATTTSDPATIAVDAKEATFIATADLTGYFADAEGKTPATNVTKSQKYIFKDGGLEGVAGEYTFKKVEFTWNDIDIAGGKTEPVVTAKVTYTVKTEESTTEETVDAAVTVTVVKSDAKTATFKAAVIVMDGTEKSETKKYNMKTGKQGDGGESGKTPSEPEQSGSYNLFYKDVEINIALPTGIKTDSDGNVSGTGKWTSFYKVDSSGTVTVTGDRKNAAKSGNSVIVAPIMGTDESGKEVEIGEFEYSLPVSYTKPSLKLTSTSGTVNTSKDEQTLVTKVTEKKSSGAYEPLEVNDEDLKYTGSATIAAGDNLGEIKLTAKAKTSGKIQVQPANWNEAISLNYSIKGAAKDVLTASAKQVILNMAAEEKEVQTVSVYLNNNEIAEEDGVTVELPKKWSESGVEISSGVNENKVVSSEIGFSYGSTLKKGSYNVVFKSGSVKTTVKVVVSNLPLTEKSVQLKVKSKINAITGQKMVLEPTLKGISGAITDVEFDGDEDTYEVDWDAERGTIIVGVQDGKTAAKGNFEKTLVITVAGEKVKALVKTKVLATKPSVKIDKITLPKSTFKAGTAEGTANILATYKLGGKTFKAVPTDVVFTNGTKGEDDWWTIADSNVKVFWDKDNGTIEVKAVGSAEKTKAVKVEVKFGSEVVKKSLSIKLDKKK